MQAVSDRYRESMNSPLRERGFIRVDFTLDDKEARKNAGLLPADSAYFSTNEIFDTKTNINPYITFERNFVTVDGRMRALPPETSYKRQPYLYRIIDTGFVSKDPITGNYRIVIDFGGLTFNLEGLQIYFGENYPVYFTITNDSGISRSYNNKNRLFSTDDNFLTTKKLTLTVHRMLYNNNRLRIYYVNFVHNLSFDNTMVTESSLIYSKSPVSENLPQVNFTVKMNNQDNEFNSYSDLFDTDTVINVKYGYHIPAEIDKIEWLQGAMLRGEKYEVDGENVSVYGRDVLQNLPDADYYKGSYGPKTVYALLADIFNEAGILEYQIDPVFSEIYLTNPVPVVTCKEALQIIANACMADFTISKDGEIVFGTDDDIAKIEANNSTYYSDPDSLEDSGEKTEYIDFCLGHVTVDGSMRVLAPVEKVMTDPADFVLEDAGFVSAAVSGSDRTFTANPVLTVYFNDNKDFNEIIFQFGEIIPESFMVRGYVGDSLRYIMECTEITQTYKLTETYESVSRLEIEFTRTAEPYNRIILKEMRIIDIADFVMDLNNMTTYPKSESSLIKDIIVYYYEYYKSDTREDLYTGEITVENPGEDVIIYFDKPVAEFRTSGSKHTVIESGSYYVKIRFDAAGENNISIIGYYYNVIEKTVSLVLNEKGETITWKNPMISSLKEARSLLGYLRNYYKANVDYSYQTRGNPELEVSDRMLQENEQGEKVNVIITKMELDFDGAFSGNLETRMEL